MGNSSSRPPLPRTTSDSLLALIAECDTSAASSLASAPVLSSLAADLVARSNDSGRLAIAQVNPARSVLLARKTRVLGSAKRLSCKQCKRVVVGFEAADVSREQLRVWAAVAGAGIVFLELGWPFAASPLLALPHRVQSSTIVVSSIIELTFRGELGSVATGDGLRLVSTAGPGLKWFKPHSRNEFSVVLAQADSSVPVWLTKSDISLALIVFPPVDAVAGAVTLTTTVSAVSNGAVSVAFCGLHEDATEVVLQLKLCGVIVASAVGTGEWSVRVPRRPFAGHACAALGRHVKTLVVLNGHKHGMAVSADGKWLVMGSDVEGSLSVHSLPGGKLVRRFGDEGAGPLQFKSMARLCFALNGDLIVVDRDNKRLQEVTLEGVFVRFIGVGEFGDGVPFCVAVHDDVIAVGCAIGGGPRVVLFDYDSGEVTSCFGEVGTAPGQLSEICTGIRFSSDGSHVMVAEVSAKRVSLFTTAGLFVRCVGVGALVSGWKDVLLSASCEYVVADASNHRVCVFSPDGSELVRSFGLIGGEGGGNGQFRFPITLAAAGRNLYVADYIHGRVQVFE